MPLKTYITLVCLLLCSQSYISAQHTPPPESSPVVEGGKVIVELIKAIGSKKEWAKDPNCKNHHADLCIRNLTDKSIEVSLRQYRTEQSREIVILEAGRECFLQVEVGIWTYDLKMQGEAASLRKGDIKIEGCNNMEMTIKL